MHNDSYLLSPKSRFALAPGVALQRFATNALLVDLAGERVYQLNETGAAVAVLLTPGRSLAEILAALSADWDALPETLEADLRQLLADLLDAKLIVPIPATE
jgi:hypothetical protein